MHRFFVAPGSLQSGQSVALDAHAHQLSAVLRLAPGAPLLLLDGSGLQYEATLTQVSARRAQALVGQASPCAGEPRLQLALFAATLKADKFEWVLQKGTELGVSRFVPVVSRRSVVRPASALAGKGARWQSIVREAAEQSGRGRLPQLHAALPFSEAVELALGDGAQRLVAWEERTGDPSPAGDAVRAASAAGAWVALLVGPEGGFAEEEIVQAEGAGWQVISLGSRILRAETASIAGVASLLTLAGEVGDLRSVTNVTDGRA